MRAAPLLLLLAVLTQPVAEAAKPQEQCGRLELADVVLVLTDFDVMRVAMPPVQACGATHITGGVTDGTRRQILLNGDLIDPVLRLSTLHELHHALLFRKGLRADQQDEQAVRRCAIRSYKAVFGGDLDLPERFREQSLEGWK